MNMAQSMVSRFDFCPITQAAALIKLEDENQEAAKKLRAYVQQGEEELAQIQHALVDIAQAQLAARKIEVRPTSMSLHGVTYHSYKRLLLYKFF